MKDSSLLKLKNLLWGMICLLTFYSCTFTYINHKKDIDDGKAVVNKFYNQIHSSNFSALDTFASDTLKQIMGANGVSHIAKTVNAKLGKLRRFKFIEASSEKVGIQKNKIYYKYRLNVTYTKGTIDEIIGLQRDNASKIEVISYNVYSDKLIE
jgi:hypothetical protein